MRLTSIQSRPGIAAYRSNASSSGFAIFPASVGSWTETLSNGIRVNSDGLVLVETLSAAPLLIYTAAFGDSRREAVRITGRIVTQIYNGGSVHIESTAGPFDLLLTPLVSPPPAS